MEFGAAWNGPPRLEVHYSHGTELAARDFPEHVLTMQASGLARIETVGGRTVRSRVIAAGGFCLAPAGMCRARSLWLRWLPVGWMR